MVAHSRPRKAQAAIDALHLGVEIGQILFVTVVAIALAGIRRIPVTPPRGAWRLAPYAIGGLATFWTIQRLVGMIPPGA